MAKSGSFRTKKNFRLKDHPSTGRFLAGSVTKGTKLRPIEDVDFVGAVILETPEQEQRLEDLKKRVDAEMVRRGMRKG